MFPIALDLTRIPIFLAGQGELLEKRRRALAEYGATQFVGNIEQATIVLVAGLQRNEAEALVKQAHTLGKLANVEDINDLCDFYFTANIRRGDLVIAVSTSGASPTLARRVRDVIATWFGPEWAERTQAVLAARRQWKAEGQDMQQVVENTDRLLAEKAWLPAGKDAA